MYEPTSTNVESAYNSAFLFPKLIFMREFVLTLFANFESTYLKNGTFLDILQKVKTYCFADSINFHLNPSKIPKKYKTETPYCRYA